MSDYSMVGSFSEGGASALNGDLINKLRETDESALIKPFDTDLELWDTESEKMDEIEAKVGELLESVKLFDLYGSSNNAFEQITANTTGTSAVFDSADIGSLEEGSYLVDIDQLAKKDVHQSSVFTDSTAAATSLGGDDDILKITIGSTFDSSKTVEIDTTQSFDQVLFELKSIEGVTASIEEVGSGDYRIVIRSSSEGEDSNIFIGTYDDGDTPATGDGVTDASESDVGFDDIMKAQNLEATVDGVAYNISSNSITVNDNLKVTATAEGESSITIVKDDSYIVPAVEELALKYNELVTIINDEMYSTEGSIKDKSSLKSMIDNLKNMFFTTYNTVDGDTATDKNPVNYGFGFDKDGLMAIDTVALGEALSSDFDGVKNLFLGVPEDKGLGTVMKEFIDGLNSYNGLFSTYDSAMDTRKTRLEDDREKAVATLDAKYDLMASQFAAYGAVIGQMEAAFGGMAMMISQSQAKG